MHSDPLSARTIVAPSTPPGVSALAVIRVSGPETLHVCTQVLGKATLAPREMTLVQARDPLSGELIDRFLAAFLPGPRSYTGEDSLELFPHGNPLLIRKLIQAIRTVPGVRLAEPGEFTRRAFLNGKLDLVQAEAVGDLLHATAENALQNAHQLLSGRLSSRIQDLAQLVRDLSVRLELEVDFSEEEALPDFSEWQPRLLELEQSLETLRHNFQAHPRHHIPRVVLYGAPNAGKSSLVNALLAEDRVLVSDIPGTTRDYVEVRLLLPGGEVHLVDTAGLARNAVDSLDERSMNKSRAVLNQADWAVLVLDGSHAFPPEAPEWIASAKQQGHAIVLSKCDLHNVSAQVEGSLPISVRSGHGLTELLQKMDRQLFPPRQGSEEFWLGNERQLECLERALEGCHRAMALLNIPQPAIELLAFEMQTIRDALRSLTGELSSEDVLQAIFSGFCIGK